MSYVCQTLSSYSVFLHSLCFLLLWWDVKLYFRADSTRNNNKVKFNLLWCGIHSILTASFLSWLFLLQPQATLRLVNNRPSLTISSLANSHAKQSHCPKCLFNFRFIDMWVYRASLPPNWSLQLYEVNKVWSSSQRLFVYLGMSDLLAMFTGHFGFWGSAGRGDLRIYHHLEISRFGYLRWNSPTYGILSSWFSSVQTKKIQKFKTVSDPVFLLLLSDVFGLKKKQTAPAVPHLLNDSTSKNKSHSISQILAPAINSTDARWLIKTD